MVGIRVCNGCECKGAVRHGREAVRPVPLGPRAAPTWLVILKFVIVLVAISASHKWLYQNACFS